MKTSLIRERYELLDVVGRGGQGEVVRALDHQHDRVVALKIRTVESDVERRAILREARVLLTLRPHPRLPIVREDFFFEDRYFIAMDWVDGVSLARILQDRGSPGLPLPEVVEYVSQAAEALDHLHGHRPSIVHQDVKPSNLILAPDGRVAVVDFGLSMPGGTARSRHYGGTHGYVAPELAAGQTPAPAADVYGLAATAFAMLTGQPPRGDLPAWENVPKGAASRIEPVMRRALSIDPDRRHASAGQFAAELALATRTPGEGSVEPATEIRTFLIADDRGYTRYTQERGDEAAARLAEAFAEIAREGVEARGGEVVELRGDEALAVFSSARQAVRAAVELQTTFADESKLDPSLPLRVGIGLDAGEAVPVQGGYRGAALNLAARLCAEAGPDEVLLSQGVFHLARAVEGVRVRERGLLDLKGLPEPVPAWRATADAGEAESDAPDAGSATSRPRGVRIQELPPELDPLTPVVGRERDDRWIRWAWRQARRGPGRAVLLTGPEGAGKSRLAAEAAALAIRHGGWVGYGSAAADGRGVPDVIKAAESAPEPLLVVLDDLHLADQYELSAIAGLVDELQDRRALIVANLRDDAPPRTRVTLERMLGDAAAESHRRLGGLDREGIRAVAALYAEEAAAAVPIDAILQATGGLPQEVHRMASQWAQGEAARRLGEAAGRAAQGRTGLRAIEAELAGSVIDLQTVRERADLFLGDADRQPDVAAETAPFKGLATFDVADAPYFFGRERLVAEMVARLAGSSFIGVVGPSGSGKSSAVRAGLAAALGAGALPGSDEWIRVVVRPGSRPSRELDRALYAALPERLRARLENGEDPLEAARSAIAGRGHLLVVVDQFEEVYTACRDQEERHRYVDSLVSACRHRDGITLIVAVRADFYGRCASHPYLAELLGANHVLVGPMTAEEYRRAIELPARRAGLRIDGPLVDALVGEVLDEPGGLPLLSTALLELWQRRQGRAIRMEAYSQTGGVRGAVARLAEEAYGRLSGEQPGIARSILLRLAAGEGEGAVRRRVPLAEFDAERNEDVARVLEVLTEARLVTVSEGTVEVAHEALLREWPRLGQWLEEDRAGRRLHQHMIEAAKEWTGSGRDAGELYRGARLTSVLDWTTEHNLELNELEREFINESRVAGEREAERQRRTNRRLRGLLVGVALFLVIALVAGSAALIQRGRAQDAAGEAREAAIAADARRLGAQALVEDKLDVALLLARQAVAMDDSVDTRSALLATLLKAPGAIRMLPETGFQLGGMESSGDHRVFVTQSEWGYGFLTVYDAETLTRLRTIRGNGFDFHACFAVAPDGRSLVAVTFPPSKHWQYTIVDLSNGSMQNVPVPRDTGTGFVSCLAYAPDGQSFVAIERLEEEALLVRYTAGGRQVGRPFHLPHSQGGSIQFAPDGTRILLNEAGTLTVLDASTLEEENKIRTEASAWAVAPDGRTVAFGSEDGTLSSVDLRTGHVRAARESHAGGVDGVGFSPDGHTLVTTGSDRKVRVWDPRTLSIREVLEGHAAAVVGLAFDPEGDTAFTAGHDGGLIAWDLTGDRRLGRPIEILRGNHPIYSAAISPDGSTIVLSEFGTEGHIVGGAFDSLEPRWSTDPWTAAQLRRIVEHDPSIDDPAAVDLGHDPEIGRPLALAFSPDGRFLAESAEHPQVVILDAMSGGVLRRWQASEYGFVNDVRFAPDGTLLTANDDGRVVWWDPSTGRLLRQLRVFPRVVPGAGDWWPGGPQHVAVSPDGKHLAVTTYREGEAHETVRLLVYQVDTGRRLWSTAGDAPSFFGGAAVAWSPDGTRIATGSLASGELILRDAETGRPLAEPAQAKIGRA